MKTEETENIISSPSLRVVHRNRCELVMTTEVLSECSTWLTPLWRLKHEESCYSDTFAPYCDTFRQNIMVIDLSGKPVRNRRPWKNTKKVAETVQSTWKIKYTHVFMEYRCGSSISRWGEIALSDGLKALLVLEIFFSKPFENVGNFTEETDFFSRIRVEFMNLLFHCGC